jgi:sarcosine oxidase subunit alpha
MTHLEYYLQVVWPELKVHVTSISEQWAQIAVAGPRARAVLEAALDGIDISNEGLPFMGVADGRLKSGIPARVFRISFSGELAYEIGVPAGHGEAAWQEIYDAGQDMEMIAYGLEALGALRVEKGHVAGPEMDGRTTLEDIGLGRMASTKKQFIGRAMLGREGLVDPARAKLVGLESVSGVPLRGGSQIVEQANPGAACQMIGHITSTTYSPMLGKNVALALVQGGLEREGQTLYAAYPLRDEHTPVRVVHPVFFDPEGERLRG